MLQSYATLKLIVQHKYTSYHRYYQNNFWQTGIFGNCRVRTTFTDISIKSMCFPLTILKKTQSFSLTNTKIWYEFPWQTLSPCVLVIFVFNVRDRRLTAVTGEFHLLKKDVVGHFSRKCLRMTCPRPLSPPWLLDNYLPCKGPISVAIQNIYLTGLFTSGWRHF